ncbi:IS607 family transposase [Turicibacter sanguinis]|uniref:IS607 family transposase n=1 Tax=Turicibacter sanguinis TaxID=154288 RepID=UPI0039934E0C
MTDTIYKPKEFAEKLGVSVKTLQRWDNDGTLIANRTLGNRRYYTYNQYLEYKGLTSSINTKRVVMYVRVENKKHDTMLSEQINFIYNYANAKGLIIDKVIKEYGLGSDFNRKEWNQLIEDVIQQNVGTIIIPHKNVFINSNFEWFENLITKLNANIIVLNNELLAPKR